MPVRVEKKGPVTTVILDRPEVRNAVDRVHADALADVFRAFEADDDAHVAVLFGDGGNFCAGADLKALAAGAPNRVESSGDALIAVLEREFAAARARGNEGLMVKDPRSPYRPGRRGMEWLKVKRPLRTLDVVVTAVEWGHGKRRGVLSDYTFAIRDGDRLLNIGKAYSGLTDKEIAEMTKYFLEHTIQDYGRVRTVVPDTVIEVAFDQIQPSDRHESGYAMRFPRIARLRPDKPVSEIDTLETVRQIAGR